MNATILSNARMALPDRVAWGSLVVEDGLIAAVEEGRRYADAIDLGGQWLIPGLIDLHSDYLEKELRPRPSASFPAELAFHMMDMRAVSCGLTTVLGACRVSGEDDGEATPPRRLGWRELGEAYERLAPAAKARHFLHVRWDTNFEPADEALERLAGFGRLGNLVYNENIPGQRQFRGLEEIARKRAAQSGAPLEEALAALKAKIERNRGVNNRPMVKARFAGRLPLGSHDDTTAAHVEEAWAMGATLAEMPTTLEAARRAKELGMSVCMGAPNLYRGGSHCGNLSCAEALEAGLVDCLCSDYHYPSMLGAALKLIEAGAPAPEAFRLVTLNPARSLGMDGRLGSLESGKQADLVAFEARPGFGLASQVWVAGRLRLSAAPAPFDFRRDCDRERRRPNPIAAGESSISPPRAKFVPNDAR